MQLSFLNNIVIYQELVKVRTTIVQAQHHSFAGHYVVAFYQGSYSGRMPTSNVHIHLRWACCRFAPLVRRPAESCVQRTAAFWFWTPLAGRAVAEFRRRKHACIEFPCSKVSFLCTILSGETQKHANILGCIRLKNKIFECICFLNDELWTSTGIPDEVEEGIIRSLTSIPDTDTWIRAHTHQIVIYTDVVTLNPIRPLLAVAAG